MALGDNTNQLNLWTSPSFRYGLIVVVLLLCLSCLWCTYTLRSRRRAALALGLGFGITGAGSRSRARAPIPEDPPTLWDAWVVERGYGEEKKTGYETVDLPSKWTTMTPVAAGLLRSAPASAPELSSPSSSAPAVPTTAPLSAIASPAASRSLRTRLHWPPHASRPVFMPSADTPYATPALAYAPPAAGPGAVAGVRVAVLVAMPAPPRGQGHRKLVDEEEQSLGERIGAAVEFGIAEWAPRVGASASEAAGAAPRGWDL